MTTRVFTFNVNGRNREITVDEDKPLLWVLREDLGLTGTKFGCGIAMCGACTVLIADEPPPGDKKDDNKSRLMVPVRSCIARAKDAQAWHIKTIEGLSEKDEKAVQQAWIEKDVPQCGYCQSGQIMTTVALLRAVQRENRELNDDDINGALAGNLCRCGTYVRIREAVKAAWKEVRKGDRQ
jgi:isoquinoline 1-oxidoreductase alpha subunit